MVERVNNGVLCASCPYILSVVSHWGFDICYWQDRHVLFMLWKLTNYKPEWFASRQPVVKHLILQPSNTYVFIHADMHLNQNFTLLYSYFLFYTLY